MNFPASVLKNFGTKVVSVLIAIVLWFVVLGSRSVEVTKEVPLEVITAEEVTVANEIPDRITFRLSGPKAFLRAILNRSESPIRVNLTGTQNASVTYRFFSDNIRVPPGVKVLGVNPPAVQIRLEQVKIKEVPIRADIRGTPPDGYKIVRVKIDPPTAKLRGAMSRLNVLREISTVPIDVTDLRQDSTQTAILESGSSLLRVEGPAPKITFEVQSINARYRIKNIPIRVLSEWRSKTKERVVHLIVLSHFDRLRQLTGETLAAEIDLRGKPKGSYNIRPHVNLPKDVTLVRTVPETVNVTLF